METGLSCINSTIPAITAVNIKADAAITIHMNSGQNNLLIFIHRVIPPADGLLDFLFEEVADVFSLFLFKRAVHHAAAHSLVKVNLKAVEFRTVHTGEFSLAAHGEAAAAAHACAVDHNGIHGNDGLDMVGFGCQGDKFHHNQRADGDDFVVLLAAFNQALERLGDNALLAVAAVVGHNDQLIGSRLEFILENEQILAAESDDGMHLAAQLVQLLRDWQSNGTAHAAADNGDLLRPSV